MRVLSLFDGISCGQVALERAGIPVDVYYASEIDKYAIQVTQNNYPNTIQLGDVTKIDFTKFIGKIDLLIGGSPCQDLSILGKQAGLTGDKSKLFYKFVEALEVIKPKYFLLENNVGMPQEAYEEISSLMGCYPIEINSALVSAQNRKRYYWTNIGDKNYNLFGFPTCAIPLPKDKKITMQDILTSGYATRHKTGALVVNGGDGINRPSKRNLTQMWKRHNMHFLTLVLEEKGNKESARYLNRIERERLQTLPENYTDILNEKRAAGVIGNGWTVDVIAHIFKNILDTTKN